MPGTSPPRNVVYYSNDSNSIPLGGISNLPYTDVILGFLVPADPDNGNYTLVGSGGDLPGLGDPFDNDLHSNIQMLQKAGKNVLISIGGEIFSPGQGKPCFTSAAWKSYAQNLGSGDLLRDILNNWVTPYGFDGVDIDFEDDNGFTGDYDGITFLRDLTNEIAAGFFEGGAGYGIITHAPQTPYWDPNYYDAPYKQIWQGTSDNQGSGINITWINNQFYDNPDYDGTPELKVQWYNRIADITGSPKLMLGVLIADNTPPDQLASQVIQPLRAQLGQEFGGVMGWEFADDVGGSWAEGIWQALNN